MTDEGATKVDTVTSLGATPLIIDKTIDVGIGIVTGILTTVFLLIAGYLFNEKAIPWYQSVVYKGIVITGTRHAALDPKVTSAERRIENDMKVTQQGHIARGMMTKRTTNIPTGKVLSETFIVEGQVRDRLFYGIVYPEARGRLSALAFLYQVEGSGDRLVGQRVFYHVVENKIKSADEIWEKQAEN